MTEAQAIVRLYAILLNSKTAGGIRPFDSRAGNNLPSAPNCDKDQNSFIDGYFWAFRGYQQTWTSNGHAPYEINWYAVKVPVVPYGMVNVGPSTHAPCYNHW